MLAAIVEQADADVSRGRRAAVDDLAEMMSEPMLVRWGGRSASRASQLTPSDYPFWRPMLPDS